jgi:hypothetical protein
MYLYTSIRAEKLQESSLSLLAALDLVCIWKVERLLALVKVYEVSDVKAA